MMYILVRNYYTEGFVVCGLTDNGLAARAWESAGNNCAVIEAKVNVFARIEQLPIRNKVGQ